MPQEGRTQHVELVDKEDDAPTRQPHLSQHALHKRRSIISIRTQSTQMTFDCNSQTCQL